MLHDTTDIRRLERLRQDFVANVSHELKTPLSVITASVETLLDGAAEDAVHRQKFLQRVADEADRLHALILDLLSLARIESGEGKRSRFTRFRSGKPWQSAWSTSSRPRLRSNDKSCTSKHQRKKMRHGPG